MLFACKLQSKPNCSLSRETQSVTTNNCQGIWSPSYDMCMAVDNAKDEQSTDFNIFQLYNSEPERESGIFSWILWFYVGTPNPLKPDRHQHTPDGLSVAFLRLPTWISRTNWIQQVKFLRFYLYHLVIQHSYWKWPFVVNFHIKHGDFPLLC